MGRKFLSNEVFVNRLKEKGILEKITPLEEYKGKNTKILFKCNVCGHEWKTRPDHITSGNGCPKCRDIKNHNKYAKTHEQFISELKEKGILDKIEILEEYYANDVPIIVRCKKCGYEWKTTPLRLLQNRLCKKCAIESKKKSNIQFILDLKEKGILESILPLEEYKGCKERILFKCLKCGKEWMATPDNILQYKGCPNCLQSSLENDIENILKEKNIEYIKQYCPNFLNNGKSHLRLDFYLPKYNIAIECQGEQHFKPIEFWGGNKGLEEQIERDERKFNLCESNGLNILYYTTIEVPKFFNHEYFDKNKMLKVLNGFANSK